jgi:hypothetical protein
MCKDTSKDWSAYTVQCNANRLTQPDGIKDAKTTSMNAQPLAKIPNLNLSDLKAHSTAMHSNHSHRTMLSVPANAAS